MMVFLSTGIDAKYLLMKLMKEYNYISGYRQYTSFGECGNICKENTVSCPSLLQFCSICRKNNGGECFNIEGQTFICSCKNVTCGNDCFGDNDCLYDERCRSSGTSICPKTCEKKHYRESCCNEKSAKCLACEQGISVKEFCRNILKNPKMMYSELYPECKGIQCVSDFVSSPWDTCNKCKCEDGRVTHNCTQFKTHSYTLGGSLETWLSKFYFIGCSGGPKHDGDLCDSEKNNCLEGFVCKDDGNMNGVGRCIPA